MKFLYKYPQRRYPYEELVTENQNRSRDVSEYEILDSDAFEEDRYWDVFVEVSITCFPSLFRPIPYIWHNFSMPKMKMTLIIFTFVSRRTIAVPTLRLCTSFLNFGFPIPGHGLLKSHPYPHSMLPYVVISIVSLQNTLH